MKRISVLLALCTIVLTTAAQKLVGSAPSTVEAGRQFRLTYTIDTHDVSGFRAGDIPSAFEVLMGPSTSTQRSVQIVNGKTSSTETITYTYILYATKNGTFTIPPAQITANGKQLSSNSVTIVVEGDASANQNGASHSGGRSSTRQQTGNNNMTIAPSDLFINVSVSKRRVHEQEPILLTYKAYTKVGLQNLSNEVPDLKGFHVQEIPLPQQRSLKLENYNGQNYNTVLWRQYVIFPQMTGEMKIPSIPFEAYVLLRNNNVDPFEAFFNGGMGYMEVKKIVNAPAVTIQVDPLPQRPANFSGGVGTFAVSATIDKTSVKANEAINMRVVVSGTGNMKLLKEPLVNFPKDFDTYAAKLTDKTKLTVNGVEGSMIYDFLTVPRHQGKYEIPTVEFVYYDTKADKYKTLKTEAFTIEVEKGEGGSSIADFADKEDLKQLNKDIRYIKTGDSQLRTAGDYFFASAAYWIMLVILAVIFLSLFIVFRQRAIDNADITQMKGKKANKVATKRLKMAAKLMATGQASSFYDEVLRALWGYVSDKLNMPVEQLSHENICQRLDERHIDAVTISLFIGALDECEFERYAPGDVAGNMNKTFNAAMTAITMIENTMKKKSSTVSTAMLASFVMLSLMLASPLTGNAQAIDEEDDDRQSVIITQDTASQSAIIDMKAVADSAYAAEYYREAVEAYENILKHGVSAKVYYNLGNAYYRLDDITHAVINYERALRLSPGDADIRFNLQMAREKTIDRITPETEMFFITWYHAIVNITSIDTWAFIALLALALSIALALLYLFVSRVTLRKTGFFGGIFLLLVFILANIFACQQKSNLTDHSSAIVISSAASVKSTPSQTGTDLFLLHEGTKVDIIDDTMDEWAEVKLADGKEGWLERKAIEVI